MSTSTKYSLISIRWDVIREDEATILSRFCKCLNDDFRKEIMLLGVFTFDQVYTVMQDYKLIIKSQWIKCKDLTVPLLVFNLEIIVLCYVLYPYRLNSNNV